MSRRYWYAFQPGGNVLVPGDYILVATTRPANFCPGGPNLCTIYAYGSGSPNSSPDFISANIQSYIPLVTGFQSPFGYPENPNEPYTWSKQ